MRLAAFLVALALIPATTHAQTSASPACMQDQLAAARWTFHRTWFEEADAQFAAYLADCPSDSLAHAYSAIVDMLLYRDNSEHVGAATGDDPFVRALASFAQGQLEEAEVDLRRHLESAPNDQYAAHVLGFTLIDQGKQEQGAVVLADLLRTHPDYFPAKNHLAYALLSTGKHDEALRVVAEFVAADPANPSSWDTQAHVLHTLGRTEEAIASLSRGLLLDERFAYGFRHMGNLLQAAGSPAAAEASYQKALKSSGLYGPDFVASVERLLEADSPE